MKNNNLLNISLVLLIICAGFACKMPFGKKKAVATGDNFEPNTICSFLNDMNFDTDEYKQFTSDYYFCTGTNPDKVYYNVTGKPAFVEQIEIVVLPEAKPEAAVKNAETIVQATELVWQKIVSKPLPEAIKQAILTGKEEKNFSDPIRVTVSHSSPALKVTIMMPSQELIKKLKSAQNPATPLPASTPFSVTSGLKAPEISRSRPGCRRKNTEPF